MPDTPIEQIPTKSDSENFTPDQLRELYLEYFTPPTTERGSEAFFEQVSLFDCSVRSYSSNSTVAKKDS